MTEGFLFTLEDQFCTRLSFSHIVPGATRVSTGISLHRVGDVQGNSTKIVEMAKSSS